MLLILHTRGPSSWIASRTACQRRGENQRETDDQGLHADFDVTTLAVDLLIKVYLPNERFPAGGAMTQYINNMKVGEKLDFVGPKGRLIYQRNGKFLIRHKNSATKTVDEGNPRFESRRGQI